MNRIEREKLKWQCRRGLLELDLVLDHYLKCADVDPRLSERSLQRVTQDRAFLHDRFALQIAIACECDCPACSV